MLRPAAVLVAGHPSGVAAGLGVRHQLVLWLVERIGANGRDAPPAVQDRVEGARSNSCAACPRAGWNSASNCSHSAGANSASAARIDGPVRSIFVVVTVTRRISANAVPWAGRAGGGPGAPAWHRSDRSQPSRNPIPAQRSMPPGFRPPGFRPPGAVAGPVGHRPLPHRPQPHHGQLHHPAPVRPASPGPSGSATPSSSWVTPSPPRPCARSSTPPASTPAPQARHRRGLAQVPRHSRLGAGVTPHGPRLSAASRSVRLDGTAHGGVALQIPSGRWASSQPACTNR